MAELIPHHSDWVVESIVDKVRDKAKIYYDPDSRRNSTKRALFEVLFQLADEIGRDWADYKLNGVIVDDND